MYNPQDYQLMLDDIPTWMRPQYRGIDWALLLVLIVSCVVVLPLATRSGLPPAPEAELVMYRILEMREGLFTGAFYPRWAANLNYGYGSPLFNHLAPLPHYIGGAYSALVGDDPQIAVKIQLIGATLMLTLSFFSFLRRRWGDLAGVFGSMVLLFSPYTLLTVPYLKTDLGLLWALALFAATLWALDRALVFGRGREVLVLAGLIALLLVADTGFSIVLFVVAVVWAISQRIMQPQTNGSAMAIGIILGAVLTAFYYVPAIAEARYVHWQSVPNSYPSAYRLDTIFQSPPPLDRSAFNHPAHLYFGVGTWLLAGVGIVAWSFGLLVARWRGQVTRSDQVGVLFFISMGLIALGMSVLHQQAINMWPHTIDPIMPMDWGGLVVMALAVVAAQSILLLEALFSSRGRLLAALSILVGILVVSAATSLYMPTFNVVSTPTTINQHLNEEARGNAMGTFRDGYLLPRRVPEMPVLPAELPRDLQGLPPNTRITQRSITHVEYEIFSAEEQSFTMLKFAYPGWQLHLNGELIEPEDDDGFMTLNLERGLNRIELQFGTTQPRRIGWWISFGALGVLILWGVYVEGVRRPERRVTTYPLDWLQQKLERQRLSAFVILVLLVAVVGARLSPAIITRQTPSDAVPRPINSLDLLVIGIRQSGVSLLGYELDNTQVASGESVVLTLYWKANGQRIDPYQVRLTLLRDNVRVKSILYKHLAAWPTQRWPIDQYVVGVFEVPMPTQPATYQLMIELGLPICDKSQLAPCEQMQLADIYDLRGPTGRQIVLPQPMIVYN